MWADAAKTQIALITGQVATSREIGEITFLALTHSPAILAVDTVLACELQFQSVPHGQGSLLG